MPISARNVLGTHQEGVQSSVQRQKSKQILILTVTKRSTVWMEVSLQREPKIDYGTRRQAGAGKTS